MLRQQTVMRLLAHPTLVDAARLYYAQPHRGYHDANHLDELIALAREHTPDLNEAEQLALLFHDAVYVAGAPRGDNERKSAALMTKTLETLALDHADLAVAEPVTDRAARIIEATIHADAPPAEAARVCDLDLWRLAAPWEAFCRHALGIRREYRHLFADDAAFWHARNAFYTTMLAKPRLFATDRFFERFEQPARANMRRALAGH
ncbi:MAG TPA: hypothetical protein VGJ56_14320 [Reyranella sp.]